MMAGSMRSFDRRWTWRCTVQEESTERPRRESNDEMIRRMRSGRLRKARENGRRPERKPNQTHDVPAKIRSWPDKGHTKKIQFKKILTSFASPAGAIAKIARRTHRDTSTSCLIGSRKINGGDGEGKLQSPFLVWLEFDYEKKEKKKEGKLGRRALRCVRRTCSAVFQQ